LILKVQKKSYSLPELTAASRVLC
jgi:hypothetical protein